MLVTEIDIAFVKPQNGLVAFASVVLNDELYLNGIAIHRKLDGSGYRLTYPTRKQGCSSSNIYHPIRKSLSQTIEEAVFQKLKDVLRKVDAGHSGFDAEPHGV